MRTFDLCPVLTIRTDDLDFVNQPKHLNLVVQRIQDKLAGKEIVVFPNNSDPSCSLYLRHFEEPRGDNRKIPSLQ